MTLLDWMVVALYLGASLALGLWVARRGARNMAEFFVGGHLRPDAAIAGVLGMAFQPGVVAELAATRDGVEDPFAPAGAHVEAAHIAFHVVANRGGVAGAVAGAAAFVIAWNAEPPPPPEPEAWNPPEEVIEMDLNETPIPRIDD